MTYRVTPDLVSTTLCPRRETAGSGRHTDVIVTYRVTPDLVSTTLSPRRETAGSGRHTDATVTYRVTPDLVSTTLCPRCETAGRGHSAGSGEDGGTVVELAGLPVLVRGPSTARILAGSERRDEWGILRTMDTVYVDFFLN